MYRRYRFFLFYLKLGAIVFFIIVLFFLKDFFNTDFYKRPKSSKQPVRQWTEKSPYLVDTSACKIPKIDPFDPSIAKFIKSQREPLLCNRRPSLTYENGTKLHINWTAVNQIKWNGQFGYCKIQPIYRPPNNHDHNYFTYLPSEKFNATIEMRHEFARVICFDRNHRKIHKNFHQFILPKSDVDDRCSLAFNEHRTSSNIEETLSVVMIGVDSVSRLNSQRYMKRMRNYLLKELGAFEMTGYNKVADNTFVNIVPMTMGKFLEEVPWNESMSKIPFDDYDFIWKQFASKGYRTLYAEDAPGIAMFDYSKSGFHRSPADYFNRHFLLAMTVDKSVWYDNHNCVTDRLETDIILSYTYHFMNMYRYTPYFAFSFISGLTHDDLNDAKYADVPYLEFLKKLQENRQLNNTVLILYSDHGVRFGEIRESYVGKMEERLPFFFIVFPQWFLSKYKDYANNLKTNTHRLTTPFDIYETLSDILYFNKSVPIRMGFKNRGISLFREIPEDRGCEEAGILPHWCTCAEFQTLSPTNEIVQNVANNMIKEINIQLNKVFKRCAFLRLGKIKNAIKLLPSEKVLRFEESENDVINRFVKYGDRVNAQVNYQLTFSTVPGNALFEATMQFDESDDSYKMVSDISRINEYGHQSDCVDDYNLRKFCFCKS
ncbi:uncharacterized protein LOC128157947 [Crassostrea angulata]|uniref:uncharacterized protein LOC128157947 n=1 Tax=Magallana angulata TaxID=2784310 RepID=UPI0022B1ACE5|nr:uncharacterized protein LOC128157947 [Crassostrea angulata]